MATKQIAWAVGSGKITLTYTGEGDGSVVITSDVNDLYEDREQTVTISSTKGSPSVSRSLVIRQKANSLPVGTTYNFDYTGAVQQVTLPPGKYRLQCWGAQGGNVTGTYAVVGSKGGYSEGVLTLTETTTLYVFVGGQGTSYTSSASQTSTTAINGGWNGGGQGYRTSLYSSGGHNGRSFPRGGGGATDIALVTSSMSYSNGRTNRTSASLLSRIIVAGGGAGASARYTIEEIADTYDNLMGSWSSHTSTGKGNTTYPYWTRYVANSLISESGSYYVTWNSTTGGTFSRAVYEIYQNSPWTLIKQTVISKGGTFTINLSTYPESTYSHNIFIYSAAGSTEPCYLSGGKLYKKESTTSTSTSQSVATTSKQGGGTSGKGQYPGTQTSAGNGGAFGFGASASVTNYRYLGGGGGGGWYGGGTAHSDDSVSYINYCGGGSGFVNTAANVSARPSGYTGLQLDSGSTIAGSSSFESTNGGAETGHSGNGYARITRVADDYSGGGSGGSASIEWSTQSGTWNPSSIPSAIDGVAYTCVSPGTNGSTVIRCTFSGVSSITFGCISEGESGWDYLTIGALDSVCTRTAYAHTLKSNAFTTQTYTYTCDEGTHFVEFCYSKDSSVDEQPDNATVWVANYE